MVVTGGGDANVARRVGTGSDIVINSGAYNVIEMGDRDDIVMSGSGTGHMRIANP